MTAVTGTGTTGTGERFVTASPAPLATVPPFDAPLVSLVTVAYGTGPIVVESIRSLVGSMATTGIAYEYIAVDNPHPTERTRARHELLLSTAGVRVVTPARNVGFGGGCEIGALHARGDVLAFVNPDVEFTTGWIEPLLAALDHHAIVIPVLLNPDGSVQEAGHTLFADGSTRAITTPPPSTGRGDADYASAACWVMRRDTHERFGGFDPSFHPAYYEDVDALFRAVDLGHDWVIVPASRIVHRQGSSTAARGVPDTRAQRATVLRRWPRIRWEQPARR